MWARQEDDGLVRVGVTAPLREVLWYAPELEVWAVDRVERHSTLATATGREGDGVALLAPLAGTLVEINPLLEVAPHALLSQPYTRGWLARVHPRNWEGDAALLLSGTSGAAEYRERLERTLSRGRAVAFAAVLLSQNRPPSGAPRAGRNQADGGRVPSAPPWV